VESSNWLTLGPDAKFPVQSTRIEAKANKEQWPHRELEVRRTEEKKKEKTHSGLFSPHSPARVPSSANPNSEISRGWSSLYPLPPSTSQKQKNLISFPLCAASPLDLHLDSVILAISTPLLCPQCTPLNLPTLYIHRMGVENPIAASK
jgi:hypothetical protein